MDKQYVIPDLLKALHERTFPTVTLWNRLEGRPRTTNFDRALKAEVRDALWMLTRQWQMGEFQGDDAGSPIFAKMHIANTQLTKFQAAGHQVESFQEHEPLEVKVERRPVPFTHGTQVIALDLRLLMGRQWLKLVSRVGNYAQVYISKYPVRLPDPTQKQDAQLCAHPEVWQSYAAVAGRAMDGALLYFYLKADTAHHAYDGIPMPNAHKVAIDGLADRFIRWFEQLITQPTADSDSWLPDRLEYQFACSAPEGQGEKVLVADEYYHGRLDWYNLEIDRASPGLGKTSDDAAPDPQPQDPQTLLPTPVIFEGMPNTRWWTFEDRRTNFGDIKPDTTELAKLLLVEFGLVYANDWFLIPYTLPTGSIATIQGMAVTNVFGERIWIEAAGRGEDDVWQRWSMFTLNIKGKGREEADTSLLLLPTMQKVQEGNPLEEVMLVRDEMANMVWGIEKTIPLPTGTSKPGAEAALEIVRFYQRLIDEARVGAPTPTPIDYKANIHYQVMNSVPENWIPFIPVHVPGDNREIQLQRAAMPRILIGDPEKPVKVRPRTSLLREGLDRSIPVAYFLHEEEVPRAGVRVTQSFQRTRWYNGRVVLWLGVRKQTGRGGSSSGLMFDHIMNVDMKQT